MKISLIKTDFTAARRKSSKDEQRLLQHQRWSALWAVNYYHNVLYLGCCSSPRSLSGWDHKINLVKKIKKNIRKPSFKVLVLKMCCFCGDNVKYRLLSNNLFQRKQQNDGWEDFGVKITNFYEKKRLLILTWNKKHLSKQVVFLTVATFEGLWVLSFQTKLKKLACFGLHEACSHI